MREKYIINKKIVTDFENKNDLMWNKYEITNIYIIHENQSKWKDIFI